MSLGCDFMRDFLAALLEVLKGNVGACGVGYFYSLFPGKSGKQTFTAHVIAYQQKQLVGSGRLKKWDLV